MIFLRDTNAGTHSETVDTPTGGLEKGEVVAVGSDGVHGFAFNKATLDPLDIENFQEQITIVTEARQALASKVSGSGSPTFDNGQTVYYHLLNQTAVESAGSNIIRVGSAIETVDEAADGVLFDFDGKLGVS